MTRRVRCAVIGSGFAGSTYAEAVRYAEDAELVAIAGGHQAPELAVRHGVSAVDDVDAVLDSAEIEAVPAAELVASTASFQDSVIPGSMPPPGSGVVRFDGVLTGC